MFGYGQSRGLYMPQQQMPMNYRPQKPSVGQQIARLGLNAASQGIGMGVKDLVVDSMQEEEEVVPGAGGGATPEGQAAKTATSAAGAGIGSVIAPGVGTMVGGAVGGTLGSIANMFFQEEQEEPQRRPMLPPPQQPYMVRPKSSYGMGYAQQYGVQNPYGFRMG